MKPARVVAAAAASPLLRSTPIFFVGCSLLLLSSAAAAFTANSNGVVPTFDFLARLRPCSSASCDLSTMKTPTPKSSSDCEASRREWFGQCIGATTALIVSMPLAPALATDATSSRKRMPVRKTNYTESQFEPIRTRTRKTTPKPKSPADTKSKRGSPTNATKLKPVNVSALATENKINITEYVYDESQRKMAAVYVDRKDYTIVTVKRLPKWIPKSWRPKEKVEIPNSQLLTAAAVAGSVTEALRTAVLYPLSTIKTRQMANPRHRKARTLKRKLQVLLLSIRRSINEGQLYAGLAPSLLVTVPASGVYCGVRDVANRLLHGAIDELSPFADIEVALLAAFIADVAALIVRTPADVLTLRLQVQRMMPNQTRVDYVEALRDATNLLPAAIVTDVPYLLMRLAGNWLVTRGNEGLAQYEIETIAVACFCALVTTPFDCVRTRIFVNDNSGELFAKSRDRFSVAKTWVNVTKESEAGVGNLYAGWFERTAYLGAGRAWFDPLRVIGYLGIRDAVLLRWFLN